MDGQKFDENKCRICLEEDVELSWNNFLYGHSLLTYKDCYYKYTQFDCIDGENFSTMICRNCSNGLEYIDVFVTKANETHNLLMDKLSANISNGEDDKQEAINFVSILVDENEIKPDVQNIPMYDDFSEECVKESEETLDAALTRIKRKSSRTSKDEKIEDPLEQLPSYGTVAEKKQKQCSRSPTCCSVCLEQNKQILEEKLELVYTRMEEETLKSKEENRKMYSHFAQEFIHLRRSVDTAVKYLQNASYSFGLPGTMSVDEIMEFDTKIKNNIEIKNQLIKRFKTQPRDNVKKFVWENLKIIFKDDDISSQFSWLSVNKNIPVREMNFIKLLKDITHEEIPLTTVSTVEHHIKTFFSAVKDRLNKRNKRKCDVLG